MGRAGRSREPGLGARRQAGSGPAVASRSQPISGVICRQMAVEPWGDVTPPASPASPPKIQAQERVPTGVAEGGCCSQHDGACHAAPGPTASERRAGERGKPLARGGFSLGETEAQMGKATFQLGRAGVGHGHPRPCRCTVLQCPPSPGSCWGVRRGAVGAARRPGVPGALAGARRPRGLRAQPSLGAASAAAHAWLRWSRPKAAGTAEGSARPRAGGPRKILSHRSPRQPGPRPLWGRGSLGRKRLPAGLDAGYKGGPESPSGMRWLPSRFPRRPRCRKYTQSWWRLPQRWAGCHAVGKGGGAQPQTQVCQHGTLAQGGGSTVGRWSWALAGTKGSCPGSRCPRLPLMFRDFALGKAGRFPRSSRLEPNIQHPGVLA